MKNYGNNDKGFFLIELLIVVAIIGILASIVLVNVRKVKEAAYFAVAKKELRSIAEALELYLEEHNDVYPPDVNRDIPPGLEEYLGPGDWPKATWPGSVYDWENWEDPVTGEKIYQISVRFCPLGEPDKCRFPDEEWAKDFDYYSSVYYCVSGPCRAHISMPIDHPGYCVNCQ